MRLSSSQLDKSDNSKISKSISRHSNTIKLTISRSVNVAVSKNREECDLMRILATTHFLLAEVS